MARTGTRAASIQALTSEFWIRSCPRSLEARRTEEIAHDLEITPSRQPPNLVRLQRALRELTRAADLVNTGPSEDTFTSGHGALTVLWEPAGSRRGYTYLRRAASREPIGRGLRPPVASAADLAGMLGALERDEDRPTIHALRRLIRLQP